MISARFRPLIVLSIGCLGLLAGRPSAPHDLRAPLQSVLARSREFVITDRELPEKLRHTEGMTNYLSRWVQRAPGDRGVDLFIGYFPLQDDKKGPHSPQDCLPGSGWEPVSLGRRSITANGKSNEVNRYVVRNGRAVALVYYWYQGRGRIMADEYQMRWSTLVDAALTGHTEEALVRLVAPLEPAEASRVMTTGAADSQADTLLATVASKIFGDLELDLPTTSIAARSPEKSGVNYAIGGSSTMLQAR